MKYDTYLCDTCKKAIDVEAHDAGISMYPHCVITENCRGLLNRVSAQFVSQDQYHNAGTSTDAWVQRPMIYNHTQTSPRTRWIIEHNLGSAPILRVYVYDASNKLLSTNDYTIESETEYRTVITFATAKAGIGQGIARQTSQKVVVAAPSTVTNQNNNYLSYANGLIIATKLPSITSVQITVNASTQQKSVLEASSTVAVDSPWEGIKHVIIGNTRYNVGAVSLTGMASSLGVNTSFWITGINGVAPLAGQSYILLASDPYQHLTDQVLTKALDVSKMTSLNQSKLSVISGGLYCGTSLLTTVYPQMETSNE